MEADIRRTASIHSMMASFTSDEEIQRKTGSNFWAYFLAMSGAAGRRVNVTGLPELASKETQL